MVRANRNVAVVIYVRVVVAVIVIVVAIFLVVVLVISLYSSAFSRLLFSQHDSICHLRSCI